MISSLPQTIDNQNLPGNALKIHSHRFSISYSPKNNTYEILQQRPERNPEIGERVFTSHPYISFLIVQNSNGSLF